MFYIKFIEQYKFRNEDAWGQLSQKSTYKTWCGFAFESLCQKHNLQLKNALGISGVYSESSYWRHQDDSKGSQIDLLIDRKDHCINICEMKFSESTYIIDKQYAEKIQEKIAIFKRVSKTKKSLFFTFISTYGVMENEHKNRWVDQEIKMDALFKQRAVTFIT